MLWDCENKANVIEIEMEWVSEALYEMLMIAFGLRSSSNERTERRSAARCHVLCMFFLSISLTKHCHRLRFPSLVQVLILPLEFE